MAIKLNQHRSEITTRIMQRFSDDKTPKMGLGAFFPDFETQDKMVSIEVQRNRQLRAVQVQRKTAGTINTFSNSTEKLFVPPFYDEKYDFTDTQFYDVTFGNANSPTKSQAFSMIENAGMYLDILKGKIKRDVEFQRAEALQTGVVTLKNEDSINYNRKAASMPVMTGADAWTDPDSKILNQVETGITFLRREGKTASRVFDMILGEEAFERFFANNQVKEAAEFRRISILDLNMPKFNDVTGLSYHGQFSTRSGKVNVWTYDDFFENPDGSYSEYIDADKVILLPQDFVARTSYAGVPKILRDKANAEFSKFIMQTKGKYCVTNYVDDEVMAHWFRIFSAPLAIPVSVDRVYTIQIKPNA